MTEPTTALSSRCTGAYGEVRVAGAFSDAATRFLARLADPPPQRTESARDGSS